MDPANQKPPWRLPEALAKFAPFIELPEGSQAEEFFRDVAPNHIIRIEALMNQYRPVPADSFIGRERSRIYVQIRLLYRLMKAGALVVPFQHRPGYDPKSGFEAQAPPSTR